MDEDMGSADAENHDSQNKSHVSTPISEASIPTPERVIKDMQFLQNSWANLADLEQEELVQLEVADTEQEDNIETPTSTPTQQNLHTKEEAFKVVVSRKRGKKAHSMS
ncbi:hypothetical protein A2U01_0010318 [Trifolium medium]|uniref:Uncharacterized protein n=1 Tax=Trifolium medium TaxID=97028 RepID=A0A392MPF1_9FABA|nr:hypothetical protein [Trifolium medium]